MIAAFSIQLGEGLTVCAAATLPATTLVILMALIIITLASRLLASTLPARLTLTTLTTLTALTTLLLGVAVALFLVIGIRVSHDASSEKVRIRLLRTACRMSPGYDGGRIHPGDGKRINSLFELGTYAGNQGVRNSWAVLAVLAAGACTEPNDAGPVSFNPTLSSRELWSGGVLRITEATFANMDVFVVLGTDTLGSSHVDDTTVVVQLPRRTAATLPIRVIAGDLAESLGDVTIHGFQSATYSADFMSGQPYAIPSGGAPLIFAGSDPGAAVFDLRTGAAIQSLPESLFTPDCIWTPSPSYDPNRFVMIGKRSDGSCGAAKLWSVRPTPQFVDSLPFCCGSDWYTSGQPSPGRWIFNWNNNNDFYICDSGCVGNHFRSGDGPNGVTISPRGDRFLWLPAWHPVVFDARTLDTAFVLPGLLSLQGAFSFDGDTLALTAGADTAPYGERLLFVRADDGTVLRDLRLDTLFERTGVTIIGPVAFDPVRPWLYATMFPYSTADSSRHPSIVVIDRTNGMILGILETPTTDPEAYPFAAAALVPSPLEHLVYLVQAANGYDIHGVRGVILRYSTP